MVLSSREVAYIDSTHCKLSKSGLRCPGNILEVGVIFLDQNPAYSSWYIGRVNRGLHRDGQPGTGTVLKKKRWAVEGQAANNRAGLLGSL